MRGQARVLVAIAAVVVLPLAAPASATAPRAPADRAPVLTVAAREPVAGVAARQPASELAAGTLFSPSLPRARSASGDAAASAAPSDEPRPVRAVASCGSAPVGFARCHAQFGADVLGRALVRKSPFGLTPADLHAAYGLAVPENGAVNRTGALHTVAVVNAYHNPNVEDDLAHYRATFGLPPCVSATGCFRQVNQDGVAGDYPPTEPQWASESALDVQMVSAICPACRILLVEARSNRLTDLAQAVETAAKLQATEISNSYGGDEFPGQLQLERHFVRPYVPVTASTGDDGYAVQYPAASLGVTAVGGTTLNVDPSSPRGWSETAWSGSGSGCSAYVRKPGWQTDTGCPRRTVADVAVVGDPATGVAMYDTSNLGGWAIAGGTSVGAPIVAAIFALNGGASSSKSPGASPWLNAQFLHDVTEGSTGRCSPAYLCRAGAGYDGPTGLGTPAGIGAFGGPLTEGSGVIDKQPPGRRQTGPVR